MSERTFSVLCVRVPSEVSRRIKAAFLWSCACMSAWWCSAALRLKAQSLQAILQGETSCCFFSLLSPSPVDSPPLLPPSLTRCSRETQSAAQMQRCGTDADKLSLTFSLPTYTRTHTVSSHTHTHTQTQTHHSNSHKL